jgi:tetratricopeptide (TPR) repeat protein
MIPLLHPLADLARRYRPSADGIELELTPAEAIDFPAPTQSSLWWEVNNYATAKYVTGATAEALLLSQRAVSMKRNVPTLVNMALILEVLGRFDEALDCATEAFRIDPADDRASSLLGESLLRLGHYAEGWPLYIRNRASMDWAKQFLPEWEGPHQSLDGKRILVIEGGGYGDNLYFLRWLDTLRRWHADIHYVCPPSLAPLARRQGFRAIENWRGNADIHWNEYDYFCPLLSLAGKLGVTLDNYRWAGPYIRGKRKWTATRRVGLCWKAGEAKSPRKFRSLGGEQISDIVSALPATHTWVSLTFGEGWTLPHIESPSLDNWQITADVISRLDLVVSVDTGVAHLAGALGIPCFVILPGASAWLYPLGYYTHPFYPSMRMFRSRGDGLYNAVENVARALESLR